MKLTNILSVLLLILLPAGMYATVNGEQLTVNNGDNQYLTPNTYHSTAIVRGDANGDNEVTVTDIVSLANHILGNEPLADAPAPSAPSVNEAVTAKEWNKNVVGWNLGNQFESVQWPWDPESMQIDLGDNHMKAETGWGNPTVTKKVIKAIKDAGFNAVRIPIRWQCHITNSAAMAIDKEWMARIKEVVGWCLDQNLKVIINVHHDKWLEGRPEYKYKDENNQKLALLWMNIATAFADYDYRLAFAGTNEVHVKDIWGAPTEENLAVQNTYNQTFIDIVRSMGGKNEKRHLIVQTYVCNPDFGLDGKLIVPTDVPGNNNDYMSVEFHYYTPWDYAGSCEYDYWGEPYKQYGASPSDEKTMNEFFDRVVRQWSDKGLGIVIGEWGVTDHYKKDADRVHENMTYYCRHLTTEARKRGFSTFIWDNNQYGNGGEKFGIFDRGAGMKVKAPWIIKGIFGE